jgi:hypothetical protein
MCTYDSIKSSEIHFLANVYYGDGEWFTLEEYCKTTGVPYIEAFHFLGMLCGWGFFEKKQNELSYAITPEGKSFARAYFSSKGKLKGAVADRY